MALREVLAKFGIEIEGAGKLVKANTLIGSITDTLGHLGYAFGASALVYGAKSFVTGIIELGDELDKTSQKTDLSIKELQAWRHAADLSGLGVEQFNDGLKDFTKNIYEVTNATSTQAKAYKDLGVEVKTQSGAWRSTNDILFDVATALSKYDTAAEKAGIANRLFGESGSRLVPLFNMTEEQLKSTLAEVEKYGGGIDAITVKMAAAAKDSIARFDLSLASLKNRIAVSFLPAVDSVLKGITFLVSGFSKIMNETNLFQGGVLTLVAVLTGPAISALKNWSKAMNAPMLKVLAIFLILEDLYTLVTGGDSVSGRLLDWIFGEGTSQDLVKGLGDIRTAWNLTKDDIERGFNMKSEKDLNGFFEKVGYQLRQWSNDWKTESMSVVGSASMMVSFIGEAVSELPDTVRMAFNAMVETVQSWASRTAKAVTDTIMGTGKSLSEWKDEIYKEALEIGKSIIDGMIKALKAGAKAVADEIVAPVAKGLAAVRKLIESKSPSKKFQRLFATIPQGELAGLKPGHRLVEQQMEAHTKRLITIAGANVSQHVQNNITIPGATSPQATAQAVMARIGKRDNSGLEAAFNSLVDVS